MLEFTFAERDRRWGEVRKGMRKRGIECLVMGGSGHRGSIYANIAYLSNMMTEGYMVFPLEGDPTMLTFLGGFNPWISDIRTGHPAYSKVIAEKLKELHMENARIGLVQLFGYDGDLGFPYSVYTALSHEFPKVKFEDAADILHEARIIKSDEEIKCLEYGAEVGEKIIQAIIGEAKPGVSDTEVKIAMMNTAFRQGCNPYAMILFNSGKEIFHAGTGRGGRNFEAGDIINTEFDANYLGYKAQFNQSFSFGKPDSEWQRIFDVAAEAFNIGINMLKPGITTRELDEAMKAPVKKAGYVQRTPNFHGLGLSLEEPFPTFIGQPNYKPNLDRIIQKGMVIELEPPVISKDFKRGTTLGCPVLVTETGCELMAKNWKPEVIVI